MVHRALEAWVACRIIERSWVICGEETLGIPRIHDPSDSNPENGWIPITPTMDTQLDQIVIQDILGPLRNDVVQELKARIEVHHPHTWFEIFLTISILLNCIEVGSAHGNRFAKSYGRPVRPSFTPFPGYSLNVEILVASWLIHSLKPHQSRFSDMKLVEGWFHTSKILLSRFHFVCNGSAPWRIDWKKPSTARFARLKADEVRFMEETQRRIKAKGKCSLGVCEVRRYADVLVFCCVQRII